MDAQKLKDGVTFIVICYKEYWEAYMFIGMMLCQTNPNWKIIIWHDGPNPELKKVVESFVDDRIKYIENDTNLGAWGAYNRKKALEIVDTKYVIQTTIQEYYVPITVDTILQHDIDFIYWNVIHHSANYFVLNSYPKVNFIDWSNFVIKTEIARKVNINHPEEYCGDGMFVEDCFKSGLITTQYKLPIILNIKN